MVKKFVNPRLAPHVDETASLRDLGVFGLNARHIVASLTNVQSPALTALAPYAHVTVDIGGQTVLVISSPELGMEGFELMVPATLFDDLWERAARAGAVPAGLEAWEIARVEAGRPEWGIDIDDNTIPQEANFDELHAISYTKGCYVARRQWLASTSAVTSTSTCAVFAVPRSTLRQPVPRCTTPRVFKSVTCARRFGRRGLAALRWP
jgi:folate-binding protein YgfZ